MDPVWRSTLGVLFAAALAAAVGGALAGADGAWAGACLAFALWGLAHVRQLAGLLHWLQRPLLKNLPQGRGLWEDALAELHRLLKRGETEREELLRALTRFRAAGQALPDGVVVLDEELRIEWANATASRHFSIAAQRDVGQPIINLVRQPDFIAYMERAEFAEPLVLRSTRNDSVLSVRVIEFGHERRLLNSRDVTAEERLDTMRRDFVANVSHELKTPVTVLSGFVETLNNDAVELTRAQRKRFLDLMTDQAQRMQRLIEDLLTLSALESGAEPNDEAPVDVRALIERLAEEARALSGGRHRIVAEVARADRLTGSLRELGSAFTNLVSNAVRYTPEGGTVTIGWRLEDGAGVFSVRDSGIGIEARHIPRLTERFYRVDSGRSRESGGTGLGLAIVKHVLTRHQATLEVESEPGHGSTFRAVFPQARVAAPDAASRAAA